MSDQEDWREFALCREVDTELFFPEKGNNDTGPAKRICNACEVQDECLREAMTESRMYGIWGGTTERERRQLKNRGAVA
ncbi:WhiB family transcriptional regulator [Prauserella endophytica]|nr:WhiB family transcriptional regulator [Prauserella endophytica]